ncbi:Yip1 family protein [Ureibacillus thermophilus]|uniref:Yip1 family protein n=1 Tax=Ureibacillus thermophilus TaxID=367743 RepID=UPI0036141B62
MNEMEISPQEYEKMNPFITIWRHPKKTTRYIIKEKNYFYIIIFLSLGYIGSTFTGFIDLGSDVDFLPLWALVLFTVILSPIFGIIGNAFSALGVWLIGKIFSGKGTYGQMFKAASLSVWPMIMLIPIYLLWMWVDPDSLFYFSNSDYSFISIIALLFTIAAFIWSIVIYIGAIAEAHQFSNWMSFFTILIFLILLFIIFFIIGLIIFLIMIFLGIAFLSDIV